MKRWFGVLILLAVLLAGAESAPLSTMAQSPAVRDETPRVGVIVSYAEGLEPWLRIMRIDGDGDGPKEDVFTDGSGVVYVGQLYGYPAVLTEAGPGSSAALLGGYNIELLLFSDIVSAKEGYDAGTILLPTGVVMAEKYANADPYLLGLAMQVAKEGILMQCPTSYWATEGRGCLATRPKVALVGGIRNEKVAIDGLGWAAGRIPFLAVSAVAVSSDSILLAGLNSHGILSNTLRRMNRSQVLGTSLVP